MIKKTINKLKLCTILLSLASVISPKSSQAEQKNNILILCIDDLNNQLGCLGHDYMHTPNLDKLASKTRLFERHYVQAPTCGVSRYAFLTGKYSAEGSNRSSNKALFSRAKKLNISPESITPSMPAWFRKHGYETISIGKVSHHPGGKGGKNWDDANELEMPNSWDKHFVPLGEWPHPRGVMHSLSNGQYRIDRKNYPVYESHDGSDTSYNDGLIANAAIKNLQSLGQSKKPFLLAVGFIRPHLPFGAPKKYMKPYQKVSIPQPSHPNKPKHRTTWHESSEFTNYLCWNKNPITDENFAQEARKHYAACISYVDKLVGDVINELEKQGLDQNTTIVLWSDHGWLLGEHGIWGKHCLFEEALLSPLMIGYPGMPNKGISTQSIVESVDIFPTLCEISGIPAPKNLSGKSLLPVLKDPKFKNSYAVSYWKSGSTTIRTNQHRLILHKDGYAELYDHSSPEKEAKNQASSQKDLVKSLSATLKQKLSIP